MWSRLIPLIRTGEHNCVPSAPLGCDGDAWCGPPEFVSMAVQPFLCSGLARRLTPTALGLGDTALGVGPPNYPTNSSRKCTRGAKRVDRIGFDRSTDRHRALAPHQSAHLRRTRSVARRTHAPESPIRPSWREEAPNRSCDADAMAINEGRGTFQVKSEPLIHPQC